MSATPRTDAFHDATAIKAADLQQDYADALAFARELERENAVLKARAIAAVDSVGHWMPAMDTCDKPTADAIRALRDVSGWRKR